MAVIITLAIFVLVLLFLNRLAGKHVKYSNRVFIGLGIGIAVSYTHLRAHET